MPRIGYGLLFLFCLGLLSGPAFGQCGINTACVTIPGGASAMDIVSELEDAWDLEDYSCQVDPLDADTLVVTIFNNTTGRRIKYVVPAGNTVAPHDYELRFALPTAALPNFDIFVDFDNAGEVLIRDGVTEFPEITMVVETPQGSPQELPLLDFGRTVLFVLGLLGVGTAYIFLRRV